MIRLRTLAAMCLVVGAHGGCGGGDDALGPLVGPDATSPRSDAADVVPDPGSDSPRSDVGSPSTAESDAGACCDAAVEPPDSSTADEGRSDAAVADPGVVEGQDTADAAPDSSESPPLFDLEAIADPATAACTWTSAGVALDDGVRLDTWRVTYRSWESIGGTLEPITIRGFAARPTGGGGALPAIVAAHGLGGHAEMSHATGPAALTGAMVLAYTGPGGGTAPENTSEGLPAFHDDGLRMFDTVPDARGSWFWGHAVAAMRGLTCLADRADVDPARLGMTGFSAGGVATLMVSGVDARVRAAVSLSATGAWDVATEAPNAWQHALLREAGLDTGSERWKRLIAAIDARALLPTAGARVLMVNGSTDEFFPLTAHVATYDAIGDPSRRTSVAANFDHGCFLLTGVESADDIEARADMHASGGQRFWFRHHFGTDPRYAHMPAEPTLELSGQGLVTLATSTVDPGRADISVERVHLWWSNDDSFLYGSVEMDEQSGGLWSKVALFPLAPNTIAFVDVTYRAGSGLFPERFSLSSRPRIPGGLVPAIRAIPDDAGERAPCLP